MMGAVIGIPVQTGREWKMESYDIPGNLISVSENYGEKHNSTSPPDPHPHLCSG